MLFALLAGAGTLFAGAEPHAQRELTRFESAEGSKVQVAISSTVVDVEMEGSSIEGVLEANRWFPVESGAAVPAKEMAVTATLRIPVRTLKNLRNGEPYGLDNQAQRKLKPDQNPNILVFIKHFELKQAPPDRNQPQQYEATGEIVIAGVTNSLSITLNVFPLGRHKLKISGQKTIRMTDFGIDRNFPVPVCFSPGKELKDEVAVSFEWILSKAKQ